jgi:hypothetical protein
MFALSKGLGAFIAPKLSDGTNWYAKIADLLTTTQNTTAGASFGSWPADLRDDFTPLFATELSVFSLGLVGVTVPPTPTPSPTPVTPPVPATGVGPGSGSTGATAATVLGAVALVAALLAPRSRRRGKSRDGKASRLVP